MSDWVCVAQVEALADGPMIAVSAAGRQLIIYKTGDGYLATDRRCSHQGADLMRGYFDRYVIECPVHQGRFSVRTGRALSAPASVALTAYPVKVVDGDIYVEI
jgi:nitrite reductase/ring-hydroxylating ferredoxin subunit